MKTTRLIFFVTTTALMVAAASGHAQGNLVVNGSFEDAGGSLNGWSVQYFNNVVPSLLYPRLGNTGGAGGIKTGVTNIPNGDNYAVFSDLGGDDFYRTQTGAISQALSTTPGQFYTLSFSAIQFQGYNNFSVGINGNPLANFLGYASFTNYTFINPSFGLPINQTWQNFNFMFQAVSNSTTISFSAQCDNYDVPTFMNGNIVDNWYYSAGGLDAISVVEAPEPFTLVLFAAGLAGGLAWRRRGFSCRAQTRAFEKGRQNLQN
jgi:hypothetical protein